MLRRKMLSWNFSFTSTGELYLTVTVVCVDRVLLVLLQKLIFSAYAIRCQFWSVLLSVIKVHCDHGACREEGRGHVVLC